MSHTTRLLVEEITVSLSHQWKNPKGNMTRISFQNWEQSPAGYLIKFGEFFLRTLKCFIHANGALSFSLLFLTASVLLIHATPLPSGSSECQKLIYENINTGDTNGICSDALMSLWNAFSNHPHPTKPLYRKYILSHSHCLHSLLFTTDQTVFFI